MIDIIIPAFNAHDTIRNTLCSILKQNNYKDINVYIIDDASDKTYNYLIDEFNALNIKVISLSFNVGPGIARNIGIEASHGDALLFLDSDDELMSTTCIANMYTLIKSNDIVEGITRSERPDGTVVNYSSDIFNVHGKMYNRKFIDKYMFRFPKTRRHEDRMFHQMLLTSNPRIEYLKELTYLYKYNKKSITNKDGLMAEAISIEDLFKATEYMIDNVIKNNLDLALMEKYLYQSLVYSYSLYNLFYKEEISNNIRKWGNKSIDTYNKHHDLLNKDEERSIYSFLFNPYDVGVQIDFDKYLESDDINE